MATRPDKISKTGGQRRYPRTRVVWPATLRTTVGSFDCLVLDLSANGARIQLSTPLTSIEGPVMLAIPRLPGLSAKVGWMRSEEGVEMGLVFEDSPGEVATLLASMLHRSNAANFTAPEADETIADGQDAQEDAQEDVREDVSPDD